VCLLLFALDRHPVYKLVLAANRDEFHARPTAPACFGEDAPELVAGRDLQAGGTWLGLTLTGRVAAVTNFRGPGPRPRAARSRGLLVRDFLLGSEAPEAFARRAQRKGESYEGFSLVVGHQEELWVCSNRGGEPLRLGPGIYGLSNHLIDTPWPKVREGKQRLRSILERGGDPTAGLLELMADRNIPPDPVLPDTGIGLERERLLAPIFVQAPGYGTRSTTVLLVSRDGRASFVEHTFSGAARAECTAQYEFQLEGGPS
jgi:uncharacterized protein with NRDE domain